MQWLGLSPAIFASIFGAAGLALVALHLVRRQRREAVVPFLELFVRDKSEARSLTFLSRRLLWLSLLLLLAIAGLLSLAMGDPRLAQARASGRNLVIAVDVSRSMGASERGSTRLELAKDEARRVVRSLGPLDRATVVAIGAEPDGRSPLTDDRASLLAAIDSLQIEDVHDDLPGIARYASEVLAGRSSPTLVLLGDGASHVDSSLDALDRRIDLRGKRFGAAGENVGIVAFASRRYRRDRSQAEIRVVLRNAGRESRTIELVLTSDERPLDVRRISIGPGETREESLRHVGGAQSVFSARIRPVDGHRDALSRDDVAYTTLPPRRTIRALVVSEDDLYLEAATWLDETVEPTVVSPSAYAGTAGFDLVVFDATLPTEAPTIPAIYFAPRPVPGRFAPFEARRDVLAPAISRVSRDDALLRHLDFDDVAIARSPDLVPQRGDSVLVAARSTPLVVRGTRSTQPFVAVAFDLRESDLPLRMAFPIFVVRAIDELVGGRDELDEGFRTDSVARIPVETEATRVSVVDPNGVRMDAPVIDGRTIFRPRLVGLYRITDSNGERVFAAGLGPADETSIRPSRFERGGRAVELRPFRGEGRSRRPWGILVAVAAALLGLEWFAHHRRWTA